jgi:hypothetical protein
MVDETEAVVADIDAMFSFMLAAAACKMSCRRFGKTHVIVMEKFWKTHQYSYN